MKLYGVTRVRNESAIIADTLDHVAGFCDRVFVYDDASEDDTAAICGRHPAVAGMACGEKWDPTPAGRAKAEGAHRQAVYDMAVRAGADWVYVFDADERAELEAVDWGADHYRLRLFAAYITPEDVGAGYLERRWFGPEYLDIPMLFRAIAGRRFGQRVPSLGSPAGGVAGRVRHYGKAISVEEWERTCDYYVNHRWKDTNQNLRQRWENRKGKAVHDGISDFGRPLITWEECRDPAKIVELDR